jgi:F-type H+-transporting ATPase subunit a
MTSWTTISESASDAAHGAAQAAPGPSEIIMHHILDIRYGHFYAFGLDFGPTRHLLYFGVAAAAVVLAIRIGLRGYRRGLPKGLGALIEILVVFVRDEIAEKSIGHDGRKFTPLLCSFFFFILVAALVGLLPFQATATGNISVTMGLALVSFAAMQYAGVSRNGLVGHLKGLVPPGLPVWLVPIMIPVEILGMFTKPFALMIRLFANMLAGHVVVVTLLMLIPLMAATNALLGIGMIPISLGLALFVMLLELLVALIQAYIFTLLSAIFIGMYAHPSH